MVAAVAAIALTHLAPETWYGPVEIRFELPVQGNPYDPDKNDVEVVFTNGADVEKRIAYFDGQGWKCRLLAQRPGDYTVAVWLNGAPAASEQGVPAHVALTRPLKMPFVRIADNRFVLGDGAPFWPLGHSLGWTDTHLYPMLAGQLPEMGENGLTWTRIWATFWDGRNPYWLPGGQKLPDGTFSQDALTKWDTIVRTAEATGVRFQWTLHHHGQVSSTVNPNWPEHPWNVKNGGFLDHAEDFFTNPEAIRRTKAYLRYVVARYADSPAIMAWELFNEVQYSDAAQKGHWDWVDAWHDEMAAYLRSIDPYHHLITTSSEIAQAGLWKSMDYYQAHGYPPSIRSMVLGDKHPTDKPYFWGETGGSEDRDLGDAEHLIVRDAVWSGLLAGNQGSAEYWSWDRMPRPGMYREMKLCADVIKASGFLAQSEPVPSHMALDTPGGAPLTFSPGLGWGTSTVSDLNLPADANPSVLGGFSSFLQGSYHPDLSRPEMTFHFTAGAAGNFRAHITGVSASGTTLVATLDGSQVKDGTFAAGSKPDETWTIPFDAGEHTVTFHNTGNDWVVLSSFSVDGIAPAIDGSIIASASWALMRLIRGSENPAPWTATGLPLEDGAYKATAWDLDTGKSSSWNVTVKLGRLGPEKMTARDAVVVLRKS